MRVLLGLLGVLVAGIQQCRIYSCNESFTDNVCGVWDNEKANLTMCQSGNICVIPYETGNKAYCRNSSTYSTRLPGEYCSNPSQCLYNNNCTENICRGRSIGKPCESDGECDTELYCYKGFCKKPEKDCTDDKKCRTDEVCNNNECVLIAQLENGRRASVPAACKSYYAEGGFCRTGPKLVGTDKNGLCTYNVDDKYKFYELPLCSLNDRTFCPPGRGNVDMEYVNYPHI